MSADYHESECEDDGKVSNDVISSVSEDYKSATDEQERKRYNFVLLYIRDSLMNLCHLF